ncbi:MAG: hypothetical protein IJ213_09340 [Bacteroidales bacterium]|nr:hypothetical protein [Bacteroidales bacterium]
MKKNLLTKRLSQKVFKKNLTFFTILLTIILTAFTCGDSIEDEWTCNCDYQTFDKVFDSVRVERKQGDIRLKGFGEIYDYSLLRNFIKQDGTFLVKLTTDVGKLQFSENYPYPKVEQSCIRIKNVEIQRQLTDFSQGEEYIENLFAGTWVEVNPYFNNYTDTIRFQYNHIMKNYGGIFHNAHFTYLNDNNIRIEYYLENRIYNFRFDVTQLSDDINRVGSEIIFYNFMNASLTNEIKNIKYRKISATY